MVLSNAQRQKAYREKLKAIARGEMIGEQVQEAMQKAIEAIWSVDCRDGADDFKSLEEMQSFYVANPKELERIVLEQAEYLDELEDDDAAAITRAAAIYHAVALRGLE
jgi:hypothetical protein